MKRFFAVIVLFALSICLLSCNYRGTYEDGYADGYSDGYSDAESEMQYLIEEEFLDGYDIGRDDGYDIGYDDGYWEAEYEYNDYGWLEDEAVHYARKYSEWHPEEAMWVIESYQNKEPFWQDGSPPSHEEYLDAIESLIRFYEYFYCAMYE